jgi:sterol desaturase/sphingolipid hydroxylase (fatty acid hydroxylase superfamily)
MLLVAGGLHLYFYVFRRQGDELHYDARPMARNNRVFTFNDQVLDNMFWSCASGVTVWSAYEVLMMWALANGYAPALLWPADAGWLILLIFLVPIWETFYFYLIHRLIHWPPLYRSVHYLHHRNINVGPWSGLSMHPLEHLIYLGSVMIHFVVPANPLLIIYHLQHFTLSAATTHTGYQGVLIGGRLRLRLGTFHHQMHHRFFECNYGGLEIPWDRWMGSFHDGTAESHQQFLQRRKLKAQQAQG